MDDERTEVSIPVVSEQLSPGTRQVATGGVRVVKSVVPHEEVIDQPLRKQSVEIRRVQIGRQVDGPLPSREVDGNLIVPVVEEVLQVKKVWILKEEIHLIRSSEVARHQETVTVSREEAAIERTDTHGNVVSRMEDPLHDAFPAPAGQPVVPEPAAPPTASILSGTKPAEPGRLGSKTVLGKSSR